ncbi:aldehyde dehydrogenase family protein [Lichenihabitans sp. Uapishka_5]|uniref:aldehyde dehydrogenase family protein n=1 Tax=Lichenihabitans sp. Uapishka_5 TaxID=3037302 RepID=UPI0029E82058|nr:aldehyde dehydrogenase family protein [Lichenihabitans sp. Uapishka_5]MDX7951037.1 aldehyde dehydrogenase family protein [Lichenihabitans sp. Uapishka_5]
MPSIPEILATMDYGPAPEDASHVRSWLEDHAAGFGHFIDGAFTTPNPEASFAVRDPARDAVIATCAQGSDADVDAAVGAARAAFPAWSTTPGHVRARHLYALARLIQKRERFLAVLETVDNGKPIRESRDIDVPLAARHFYHHAGWAELIASEFPDHAPVGVCGQIIPWNFPLLMLAWKIAPALAAGNTVVLKPAEFTPLTALAFAELCREAGLPKGVVNVVTGDGVTGAALVRHPHVDKVAFTGSTEVGRLIRAETAGSGKKLSLELGGKSPFIVFDDADLDGAVEGVVDAIWFNGGQVCCAGSRILVQEGVAERFHAKLKRRMASLRTGDPLDKSTDMGAIVAPVQLERIRDLVALGTREGATLHQAPGALPERGCFFPPTLMTEVAPASTVAEVEIFGPVAVSMTFRTPDEAVALANNTRYGLAASIWTESINLALEVAATVKAGVVWINATNMFDAAASFGGFKESGFGREGGRAGLMEYLVPKWTQQLPEAATPVEPRLSALPAEAAPAVSGMPSIDRTAKLYVGGKQARPDSGYSFTVRGTDGAPLGQAGLGNRKDIRNAVEAASKAVAWSAATAHNRAQVLYYVAENLAARADDFAHRLAASGSAEAAAREVEAAIARTFFYAAWADKYDGQVQATKSRHVTLAMHEPWGTMGLVCPDEAPLLAFVSLLMPALAMGNRAVIVPSPVQPLAATDFIQVLDTSDVPGGVVNIVTGERDGLAQVLADHHEVAALWYVGSAAGGTAVEKASASNLKATWTNQGRGRDWLSPTEGQGAEYLRRATQVKTVWVPYGE